MLKFFKKIVDSNYDPVFATFKNNFENNIIINELELNSHTYNSYLNISFSFSEMLDAMLSCNNISPGPDDIPYSFIKNFPNNSLNQLLQIHNLIWKKGFYPDS